MAACTDVRIDHQNNNISASPNPDCVYDPDLALGYFIYANDSLGQAGLSENNTIWFRSFDPNTETFAAPIEVVNEVALGVSGLDNPRMVRLSDGRLVITFDTVQASTLKKVQSYESTDNGATWTGPYVVVDNAPPAGGDGSNRRPISMTVGADDTVYMAILDDAAPKKIYFTKRTGIGTWLPEVLVYDGHSNDNFDPNRFANGPAYTIVSMGNNKLAIVLSRYKGVSTAETVSVMRSTDNGASWTAPSDIITAPQVAVSLYPSVLFDVGTQRLWISYFWNTVTTDTLGFAYSDDYGITWVDTGRPATLAAHDWRIGQTYSFLIRDGNLFAANLFATGLAYRVFRSPIDGSAWTEIFNCTYTPTLLTTLGGAIPTDTSYWHFFDVSNVGVREAHMLIAPDLFDITPPVCIVYQDTTYLLEGSSVELCGPLSPEGKEYWYSWLLPDGTTGPTTRCIDATQPGLYTLTVTDPYNTLFSICQGFLILIRPQPEGSVSRLSVPHRRGDVRLEGSGHPAGNPTIRRTGT